MGLFVLCFSFSRQHFAGNLDGNEISQKKSNDLKNTLENLLHTSTFDQNSFHSTVHPAPGMTGVSKEVKMHDKLEIVKNNMLIVDF